MYGADRYISACLRLEKLLDRHAICIIRQRANTEEDEFFKIAE
jgi:hypothetical protein